MKNLIIFLLLAMTSCFPYDVTFDPFAQDPNPPLPPITTEGLNKLGCLIDGKVYVSSIPPGGGISGLRSFYLGFDTITRIIALNTNWVTNDHSRNQNLNFRMCTLAKDINFCLQGRDGGVPISHYSEFKNGIREYYIDYSLPSEFNITHFDSTNYILSGTFSFYLVDSLNKDTLVVTKGRFDGKFRF